MRGWVLAATLLSASTAGADAWVTPWPAELPCARPKTIEFRDHPKSSRALWSATGKKPTLSLSTRKKRVVPRGLAVERLDLIDVEWSGNSTESWGALGVSCPHHAEMVLWRRCQRGVCAPEVYYPKAPLIETHWQERDALTALSMKQDDEQVDVAHHAAWIALTRVTLEEMRRAIGVACGKSRCSEAVDALVLTMEEMQKAESLKVVSSSVRSPKAAMLREWKLVLARDKELVEWQCLNAPAPGSGERFYCVLRIVDENDKVAWLSPYSGSSPSRAIDVTLGERDGRIFWQIEDGVMIDGTALRLRESLP